MCAVLSESAIKPLRAYSVLCEDDNTGGIIFARHSITALRDGASTFGSGEIEGWRARRAQWADPYAATGAVPMSVCITHGWWFECSGCGRDINEGVLDELGLPASGVIGNQYGDAYCCEACKRHEDARRARINVARAAGLDAMRAEFRRRLPGASLVETRSHGYADETDGVVIFQEGSIHFDFPGQQIGPATLNMRRRYRFVGPLRPEFSCCAGDREAFEAWIKTVRRPS